VTTAIMPTIDLGWRRTAPRARALTTTAQLFLDHGSVLIRGAFSPAYVRQLHRTFVDGYRAYFRDRHFPDALTVGDKRTMVTVEVRGRFNSPRLYANPVILPVLESLLGRHLIVGGLGAVVSLPGARDQHVHRDHPHIFDGVEANDTRTGGFVLPPYAVTAFVPLVPINAITGTIRVWPGSQDRPRSSARNDTGVDPVAALGDCLLMDSRLLHHGTANHSENVRPVLYLVYQRPWFRDCLNYEKQLPVRISAAEYSRVPARFRVLFDWLRHEPCVRMEPRGKRVVVPSSVARRSRPPGG
jgi:phytanoyl-CoA dioxygenase PhyH